MTIHAVTSPRSLDLTHAFLASVGMSPVVAGTDGSMRLRVLDSDGVTPLSLDGATVVLRIYDQHSGTDLMTRTSGVAIAGSSPSQDQIEIDTDQEAGEYDDEDGRGWFEWFWTDADEQLLSAAAGLRHWSVTATWSGDSRPVYAGRIEIGRVGT